MLIRTRLLDLFSTTPLNIRLLQGVLFITERIAGNSRNDHTGCLYGFMVQIVCIFSCEPDFRHLCIAVCAHHPVVQDSCDIHSKHSAYCQHLFSMHAYVCIQRLCVERFHCIAQSLLDYC